MRLGLGTSLTSLGAPDSGVTGTEAFNVRAMSRFTFLRNTGGSPVDHFFYRTGQASGGANGWIPTIDAAAVSSTGGRGYQSAFNTGSATLGDSIEFDFTSSGYTEAWFAVAFNINYNTTGDAEVFYIGGPTEKLFRIAGQNTTEHWIPQYWNGSAWTDIGSTITAPDLSANDAYLIIHVTLDNSSGNFTVYNGVSEAQIATFSGDTILTADSTITRCGITHMGSTGNVSAIMVGPADLRLNRIEEDDAASAGSTSTVTNDYLSLDDYVHQGTANFVTADAADEEILVTMNTIGATFSAWSVDQVIMAYSAQASGEPPLYLKPLCRASGTTYENSKSITALTAGYATFDAAFTTNPSTGSAWANAAAVDGAEWGFRAKSTA